MTRHIESLSSCPVCNQQHDIFCRNEKCPLYIKWDIFDDAIASLIKDEHLVIVHLIGGNIFKVNTFVNDGRASKLHGDYYQKAGRGYWPMGDGTLTRGTYHTIVNVALELGTAQISHVTHESLEIVHQWRTKAEFDAELRRLREKLLLQTTPSGPWPKKLSEERDRLRGVNQFEPRKQFEIKKD